MESQPITGIELASVAAGIRYAERPDLVVVSLPGGSVTVAVFTQNAFEAAPVTVAREHLRLADPRFLLINSGNANAGTGKRGIEDARASCRMLAKIGGCQPSQVLPFSTGVIGEYLPIDRIEQALPHALVNLHEGGWGAASRAIMTTDTVPKLATRRFVVDGHAATITGIAKGAGMIRPDMATMLAFIGTDAAVGRDVLRGCLAEAVDQSFNRITVDGDTSTNDACVLIAAGTLGNERIDSPRDPRVRTFSDAVQEVCSELAAAIIRDAEGATKLVRIDVSEAASVEEARTVADAIAHSPLVKTALFAADPNWGRILAAVGRAPIPGLDITRIRILLDDCPIVSGGERDPDYRESDGRRVMERDELTIAVRLGRGDKHVQVLTCDLSYDYVRINAEYRT
jgi:glutamate N-acetyltransferase/amino-acid N-acetyltransferase